MVVKACLSHQKITEVPIVLHPDGRDRPPHLRSFRDGWRHLRFMLLCTPTYLFIFPGLLLSLLGLAVIPACHTCRVWSVFRHSGPNFMYTASMVAISGFHFLIFGLLAQLLRPSLRTLYSDDPRAARSGRLLFSVERGLTLGVSLMALGVIWRSCARPSGYAPGKSPFRVSGSSQARCSASAWRPLRPRFSSASCECHSPKKRRKTDPDELGETKLLTQWLGEMTVANPWLSVVMPVLNGANYLAQALQSVACQADDEMELIVVDGGSTDGTTEILDSFASRLPLRLFQCDHLKGWVKTTNFGLSQAIGDYVCFLHQDDLWLDGRAQVSRELIERHADATMFLHPAWFIDRHGARIGPCRCPLPEGVVEPRFSRRAAPGTEFHRHPRSLVLTKRRTSSGRP